VAPNDKAPTSPSQILAGQTLKYKKAINEPIHKPINIERVVSSIEREITKKAKRQINSNPVANPSKPSEILTAFAKDTIVNAAKFLGLSHQKNEY